MASSAANQTRRRTGLEADSTIALEIHDAKPSTFQHKPLDANVDCLRLINIEPASAVDNPIVCHMFNVTFGAKPQYEALSYRWGDATGGGFIVMNGMSLHVGQNLLDGLRYLRSQSRNLPIWIDALCINQSDVPERNRQLQIMHHIYERAATVVVWLGAKYCKYDQMIAKLASGSNSGPDDSNSASEKALVTELSTDEYWGRLWIVQEIGKAHNLLVGFGGSDMMTWDRFIHMNVTHGLGNNGPGRLETLREDRDGDAHTLRKLLETHGAAKCSERRDKIYGLVGLAIDAHRFPMDYTKPLIDVWMDVMHYVNAKGLVRGTDLLLFGRHVKNLLYESGCTPLESVLQSLGTSDQAPLMIDDQRTKYPFKMDGYLVGQVAYVGPSTGEMISSLSHVDIWDESVHWIYQEEVAEAQQENRNLKRALLGEQPVKDCFSYVGNVSWRMPSNFKQTRLLDEYQDCFQQKDNTQDEVRGGDEDASPRLYLLRNQAWIPVFWKMGITTQETRAGDLVFWLQEGRQALIVRAISEGRGYQLRVVGRAWMTKDLLPGGTEHASQQWLEGLTRIGIQLDATSLFIFIS